MSDTYPVEGSPYQRKSSDERAIIMNTSTDPVATVMSELGAILLDQRVQLELGQSLVPTTLILPWINDLYFRGKSDGATTEAEARYSKEPYERRLAVSKPLVSTKKDVEMRLRERDSLDAMLKRYLGSLQREIITPEDALRNLREDYARFFEGL